MAHKRNLILRDQPRLLDLAQGRAEGLFRLPIWCQEISCSEVAPGIRTATLGGSNPSTEGLEDMGKTDVASPPNFKAKVALEALVGDQTLAELAAQASPAPQT